MNARTLAAHTRERGNPVNGTHVFAPVSRQFQTNRSSYRLNKIVFPVLQFAEKIFEITVTFDPGL